MREELFYEEDFVCAGRGDHPALAGALDLDSYLSLRHLQVSTSGNPHGYVDSFLAERGLKRKVAVTVGHFLMAPYLVDSSDLVVEIPPFRVVQAWHARHDADSGHEWLPRVLREISQQT
ncbi:MULTISPECIES: hypothetical protein [Ensifer]|jgi:DNA-binding transcriptional LysR family regulator|uniref:hypothetical protein n=1 Tax=Ensifer TaxID=106591 RepID=UPI000ACD5D1D|nr:MULTISPECIES: hypothetical protein [Ensifer]